MDLTKIKSAVLNQLTDASGLYSLKLQNHIYGCFIVLEDIGQGHLDVSGTLISTPKYVFDFDKQFGEIGLRYGFVMDTKLKLDTISTNYKDTWLEIFKDISLIKDMSEIDRIEDSLIEIVQSNVKSQDAFFISALETGSLPQEWIEKVLNLLSPPPPHSPTDSDEEVKKTAISQAKPEKPLNTRPKGLNVTRRARPKTPVPKKSLAKTRRHH
jgi:hypothetical protein